MGNEFEDLVEIISRAMRNTVEIYRQRHGLEPDKCYRNDMLQTKLQTQVASAENDS